MRRVVSVWFPTLPTDRIRRQSVCPPDRIAGARNARERESDQQTTHRIAEARDVRERASDQQTTHRIAEARDASRKNNETPVITVVRDGNRRLLAAVDRAAATLGLYPGMRLAHAQALVADLAIHDTDPGGDTAALQRLGGWCLRYAPLVAPDPPDGLWIDVTGSTHLWGDEVNLLLDLVRRLSSRGLSVRAALADTPALAHAMARCAADPICVMPHGAPVPDLPLEALRLPSEIVASLRLMGFERVTPLAAAARPPLVRRFGTRLATRLDQLAGKVFEPILPLTPETAIQARLGFIEPLLTAEAFATVIAHLTTMVCADLERAGRGARCLDLLFERVDGTVQALRIGVARPNRDPNHLGRMLDERLERVDPGLGVEAMRLLVVAADRVSLTQTLVRLPDSGPATDIAPLVDRLANRLGNARLYRVEPVESDVPERSVCKAPPVPGPRPAKLRSDKLRSGRTWPADLPRPVRLLDPPQPVEAMALLPDHPPVAFTWRRIRHRVRRADGPERIAGEWWKRDGEMRSVRDYYRVEDEDGRRFWLFRRGDGSDSVTGDMRWFLHGFF